MGKNAIDDFGGKEGGDRLRRTRDVQSVGARSGLHLEKAEEGEMRESFRILGKRGERGKRALVRFRVAQRLLDGYLTVLDRRYRLRIRDDGRRSKVESQNLERRKSARRSVRAPIRRSASIAHNTRALKWLTSRISDFFVLVSSRLLAATSHLKLQQGDSTLAVSVGGDFSPTEHSRKLYLNESILPTS